MKIFFAFLVLLGAAVITALLYFFQPDLDEVTPERPVARVEVLTVQPEEVRLTVRSQGTVLPRTETDIASEVSGRVIRVGDNFRAGRHFRQGEVLLAIDPADYEAAVAARAADLASARLTLAQETALAEQAAADWSAVGDDSEPSALTLRKPQLAQAEALVASAEAALNQARRNLDRTAITAPYDGRVLSKSVDLGQFVTANPAVPIARIYATEAAEIRLPVTEREANFIDEMADPAPVVQIFARNDRQQPAWTGRLTRLEGAIDPASRMLHAVAEVEDAFNREANSDTRPLRRGQFVEAEIQGRLVAGAYVLPRYALRGSDTVYIVTEANTLQTRRIEIVKTDTERVIIRSGLEPGERVATSPIAYFIENMPIEVVAPE